VGVGPLTSSTRYRLLTTPSLGRQRNLEQKFSRKLELHGGANSLIGFFSTTAVGLLTGVTSTIYRRTISVLCAIRNPKLLITFSRGALIVGRFLATLSACCGTPVADSERLGTWVCQLVDYIS
jgi:hypothetical protein